MAELQIHWKPATCLPQEGAILGLSLNANGFQCHMIPLSYLYANSIDSLLTENRILGTIHKKYFYVDTCTFHRGYFSGAVCVNVHVCFKEISAYVK